jgi:hypothetical protein
MSAVVPDTGRGSAVEDTPRQKAVVVVLCLTAVAIVGVAVLTDSYLPLFFAWIPQNAVWFYLSRSSKRRSSLAAAATASTLPAGSEEPSQARPRPDLPRSDRPPQDRPRRPRSGPSPPGR